MDRRRITILGIAGAAAALAAVLVIQITKRAQVKVLTGVVLRQDSDSQKQTPIANAKVDAQGFSTRAVESDGSGVFHLNLRPRVWRGENVTFEFDHPDYKHLRMVERVGDQIYIARLMPVPKASEPNRAEVTVSNLRTRYATSTTNTVNVGSSIKTFQVANIGAIPCQGRKPCSPDGKWKAAIGGASLDAGEANAFVNARVSCIAGPCSFTRIETDAFSKGGRIIRVAIRNWSDTTTFLFEGEVTHTMLSDTIRQSYPAIFGQGMDFTLPASAQGPSIEAELNGADIVFPLGPNAELSWAKCDVKAAADAKLYRCELRPGFRFAN